MECRSLKIELGAARGRQAEGIPTELLFERDRAARKEMRQMLKINSKSSAVSRVQKSGFDLQAIEAAVVATCFTYGSGQGDNINTGITVSGRF
jgi:hypothetical protein